MRRTLELVSAWRVERFELAAIPEEDSATYEMISIADTAGTFQIERQAQMSMLPRLNPGRFMTGDQGSYYPSWTQSRAE